MENRKIVITLYEFEDMMRKYFDAGYKMGYENRKKEIANRIRESQKNKKNLKPCGQQQP